MIRIISDSTCELSLEEQQRLNITVVPLTVHFGEESFYDDGIELSKEQFFSRLERAEELPTTSMVPPERFVDVFRRYIEAGDEALGIFLSSEISGTYQAACMAMDEIGSPNIHLIDSRSAFLGLGLLVYELVKLRDAGLSIEELVRQGQLMTQNIRFLAIVNTLKYLRKGGRISAASAVVGEILGMKPLVTVVDGIIRPLGKARGMTAAIKQLLVEVKENLPDLGKHQFMFANSGAPELMEKAISHLKDPLKLKDWLTCELGAVIGTYAGKGCVGVAYIARS